MNRRHPLPAEVYALVEQTPATVLLESAMPPGASGAEHWSRLFTAPSRILAVNEPAAIPEIFAEIEKAVAAGGFAAGYFAYECGGFFEPTAPICSKPGGEPLAWIGIYPQCYVFDHETGAFVDGDPPGLASLPKANEAQSQAAETQPVASLGINEQEYSERIAAIHEWIRAGDVYQLNFTFPLRIAAPGSPAALYARLSRRQPVQYSAFLHPHPGRHILSFSPELFFRVDDERGTRRITTRPMKGTAPRGRTNQEDRDRATWLKNDEKNRSENVMIVDLLRNDLGRLCNFGSVRVENLFAVERYETLWQMTSTVTGTLRREVDFRQIFRALFPCGSVTGAPKVRAMQLLAEIESTPRGIYTGAIGFFSRERTVFNVAIRTLELECGSGRMGVGSGIVIDSKAAGEFRECALKAEFLTRSAEFFPKQFQLIETMLWRDGFPLLPLHLDRLQDSALYFGFACERAVVEAALLAAARAFVDAKPRKVRLLVARDGSLEIAAESLLRKAGTQEVGRVSIATERTDSLDRMLFHKTTHRPLYAQAFSAASVAGLDDVLFLNERGEVTEGAISNIFIEKDGRWFTPPVECGLLAGVYRRHLLETRQGIEERVLFSEDLRLADAVYLANAVRGLRKVAIDWESQTSCRQPPIPDP